MTHPNCLNIYNNTNQIKGMYSLFSYYDGWIYNRPLSKISEDSEIYDLLNNIWEETCDKLNIKNFQKIRKNYKITVPEFMDIIKEYDRQDPINL